MSYSVCSSYQVLCNLSYTIKFFLRKLFFSPLIVFVPLSSNAETYASRHSLIML